MLKSIEYVSKGSFLGKSLSSLTKLCLSWWAKMKIKKGQSKKNGKLIITNE